MPKMARKEVDVSRSAEHYLVAIIITNEDMDDKKSGSGFIVFTAEFSIPLSVGDGMTYDQLIAEAFSRFDSIKNGL